MVVIGETGRSSDRNFQDWMKRESRKLETTPTHREYLATLNYSSGTTSEPKGIPHAHQDLLLCAELWGVNTLRIREDDRTLLAEELIACCRERMVEYKRPRWIEFVAELLKTATGKIQRFKLRE